MSRRILITGATGFIGRHLFTLYRSFGHTVLGTSRKPSKTDGIFAIGDCPRAFLAQIIADHEIDAILHVAGLINGPADAVQRATEGFTADLMRAVRHSGRKPELFFLSSVSATREVGFYGRSKRAAENIIVENAPSRCACLRASLVHGPGDSKNVATLIRAARYWPVIPVIGAGVVKLQPLYLADLAAAFTSLLHGKGTSGSRYTVCGPRQELLIDMIKIVQCRLQRHVPLLRIPIGPTKQIITVADRLLPFLQLPVQQIQSFGLHPPYDATEAQRDLDFKARSFAEAVADYVR
jgi:nucleoside-diphosphate-sugar epimerase